MSQCLIPNQQNQTHSVTLIQQNKPRYTNNLSSSLNGYLIHITISPIIFSTCKPFADKFDDALNFLRNLLCFPRSSFLRYLHLVTQINNLEIIIDCTLQCLYWQARSKF